MANNIAVVYRPIAYIKLAYYIRRPITARL